MTSVNAELFHREYDPPMAKCPKCGAEHEDHDGLGVLYCSVCFYCEHPSASESPLRCDICGRLVVIE